MELGGFETMLYSNSKRLDKTTEMETNYKEFLEGKTKSHISSGFDIDESDLSEHLFDFQRFAVKWSLKLGRSALFEDCGLGKTAQMLEWSKQVVKHTNKPVLILAPLAVVGQTIQEGVKFNTEIERLSSNNLESKTYITNYEQIDNYDMSLFYGVVLDESSILKGKDSKTKQKLMDLFLMTPYKLCCTATPSPNDHMELGNHSQFLGSMSYLEMLAMYFVHDGGETSKWRLRKHAEKDFWKFVSSWGLAIDNPKTLGFTDKDYTLPKINFIEHFIEVETDSLNLFGEAAVSATELNSDLRKSLTDRVDKAQEIVRGRPNDQWILWGLQNAETQLLSKSIDDAVNVQGSDKPDVKAKNLLGFANNDFNTLVTKASIASFGMNYQNCSNMIFVSYDFKFEAFYQAVRRCYRFGQTKEVTIDLVTSDGQEKIIESLKQKTQKAKDLYENLVKNVNSDFNHEYKEFNKTVTLPKFI